MSGSDWGRLEELLQDTAWKYGCEYCLTNIARACNFFYHRFCDMCFVIYCQEQKKWWENVIFTMHVLSRLTALLTWATSLGWTSAVTCCNIYREYHAPIVLQNDTYIDFARPITQTVVRMKYNQIQLLYYKDGIFCSFFPILLNIQQHHAYLAPPSMRVI